jgi:hypothetical protein
LFNVGRIRNLLAKIEERLTDVASIPPDKPLASDDVREAVYKAYDVSLDLFNQAGKIIVPISYREIFRSLFATIHYLEGLATNLHSMCGKVSNIGIPIYPNPCETHTLDSHVEWIIRDFSEFTKHVYATVDLHTLMRNAEDGGKMFLEHLKLLSSTCTYFIGANCLKHASPDEVTSAPLRSYILDLSSAVRYIDGKFAESYEGVKEWRVGFVRLYEHRKVTGELSSLAEHATNILHKQLEMEMAPRWLKNRTLVFSLRDRVEITIYTVGDIVVKPGWVVDVYPASEKEGEILRRILELEGHFKTEPTAYGFRVIIPPGDIREAVKMASMLPAIPSISLVGEREAYKITMAKIELLEAYLQAQKPIEKRRRGL